MPLFAGSILTRQTVRQGWLEVEGGRITAHGWQAPPRRPDAEGWIVPAAVNAHSHAADTFLRERPGKPDSLGPLVGPGGWKNQHLARATPEEVLAGIERLGEEGARVGAPTFLDFREGGLEGIRIARRAAADLRLYGRPAKGGYDHEEARQVAAAADGIGLSALRDFGRSADVDGWAEAAREARKPFAVHWSEGVHEPVDAVLALEPSFVVHACKAGQNDIDALAAEDVPVVLCPRSNRRFGLRPPVKALLAAGVRLAVGTDNGMLHDADIWQELGLLKAWHPELATEDLLRMATWHGRALAGLPVPTLETGAAADWIVLPPHPIPVLASGRPAMAPREAP